MLYIALRVHAWTMCLAYSEAPESRSFRAPSIGRYVIVWPYALTVRATFPKN